MSRKNKLAVLHPDRFGYFVHLHDAVLNMFKDYYHAVENNMHDNGSMHPTFKSGYIEMKILEAVLKSVKEKSWVTIDY